MYFRKIRNIVAVAFLAACMGASARSVYDIYPVPHEQVATAGTCSFTPTVSVVAEKGIDNATKARLVDVLSDHGLKAEFAKKPAKGNAAIYLGVNGSKGSADKLGKKLALKRDIFSNGKYDRHILSLTSAGGNAQLVILGENTNAVFFGIASLEQMLDRGNGNLPCVTLYDYADIKDRGVIEGYYGMPYSLDVTKDLLKFMMRYKMNSYMYGAKSDAYHSQYWEKPYPTTLDDEQKSMGCFTSNDMKEICKVSAATKVNFIWAIHPGQAFTGKDDNVIDRIMGKFELMHGLGVRQFAVFVDDVGVPTDAPTLALNARRLTDLQNAMDRKWNFQGAEPADTLKPLHFVPQLYAYGWEKPEVRTNFYKALSNTPHKTQVYITGQQVWTVPNNTDLDVVETDFGRGVAWWWNYPCNDNADAWTFPSDMYSNFVDMPAIDGKSTMPKNLKNCASLLSNPMQQGEIAKIPLFSVADFAWNNSAFNSVESWNAAVPAAVGKEYAKAVAGIVPFLRVNDSEEFGRLVENYKNNGDASALKQMLSAVAENCEKVSGMKYARQSSQRLFFDDIRPWVLKLGKTAKVISGLLDVAAMDAGSDARKQQYAALAEEAASLKTDPDFSVLALEGMGNGIGKQVYNVQFGSKYITPFVDYLLDKAK
jgi:hyaluronoglucosaminidase